jgi:hypothetical protein
MLGWEVGTVWQKESKKTQGQGKETAAVTGNNSGNKPGVVALGDSYNPPGAFQQRRRGVVAVISQHMYQCIP